MMVTLKNRRDLTSGNPTTVMELDDRKFTFPGVDRLDRADALLAQLGFKKAWKQWKLVGGGCTHPDCRSRSYLRIRVTQETD